MVRGVPCPRSRGHVLNLETCQSHDWRDRFPMRVAPAANVGSTHCRFRLEEPQRQPDRREQPAPRPAPEKPAPKHRPEPPAPFNPPAEPPDVDPPDKQTPPVRSRLGARF
jgi:hypothetical protein